MNNKKLSQSSRLLASLICAAVVPTTLLADQVIVDDLIVEGSACIGIDCANGESFGFDTLRLKENNLRIKAEDTSSSASFPGNDWQITFNDSGNGGANKFSIDDIDGAKTPFTIEAGAPSNSLYVEDGGRLGLGTSTPVVDAHIVSGNTPTVRLEQDGSSGFTPQSWDMAGNETNFFIRDVTNGSKLPFKIQPNAPTNSVFIAADGDIGLNEAAPDSALHIKRLTGDKPQVILEDSVGQWSMGIGTTGNTIDYLHSGANSGGISFSSSGDFFIVNSAGPFTPNMSMTGASGNTVFRGTVDAISFNPTSSRSVKEGFSNIDVEAILDAVANLEISRWSFKQAPDSEHIGPMAEDFYAAFGKLGKDDRHISTVDSDGVALAAIKALNIRQQAKDKKISYLQQRLTQKDKQLESLTARLEKLERSFLGAKH